MHCRVQFFEHELAYCYENEVILWNYRAEDLIKNLLSEVVSMKIILETLNG